MGYGLAIHAFGGKYGLVREWTREAMPLLLAGEAKWLEKWDWTRNLAMPPPPLIPLGAPKGEVPERGLNPPPPRPLQGLVPSTPPHPPGHGLPLPHVLWWGAPSALHGLGNDLV